MNNIAKQSKLIHENQLATIYRLIIIIEETSNSDLKIKALNDLKKLIVNIDLNEN